MRSPRDHSLSWRRVSTTVCIGIACALGAACTPSDDGATGTTTSATQRLDGIDLPRTPSTTVTSTNGPAPTTKSGILIGQKKGEDRNGSARTLEIGFVDPGSGTYDALASFDVSNWQNTLPGFRLGLAPSLDRYALTKSVNGDLHAGWVDLAGTFTDINRTETADPFGGTQGNIAIGFDNKGDFYYTEHHNDGQTVFRVPAGSTSVADAQFVVTQGKVPPKPFKTGDGVIHFNESSCFGAHSEIGWLGPDTYLVPLRTQIYKASIANVEHVGSCGDGDGSPLLPPTNTVAVTNPIGSPDGNTVAFTYDRNQLYTVEASGVTQPRKVNVSPDINVYTVAFIDWL